MLQAVVVTIAKLGKDPSLPGSYRPISLLNIEVKILSKILACRLMQVQTDIVLSYCPLSPRRHSTDFIVI